MGKILIERYLNNNQMNKGYRKTYGRIKARGTYDTRKLAEHIQSNGSVYTLPVILGVLAAAEKCIPELLLEGQNVKLTGLGTFRLGAHATGELDTADWSPQSNIRSIGIRFLPEQSQWSDWRAKMLKAKAEFETTDYVVIAQQMVDGRLVRKLRYDGGDVVESLDNGGGNGGGGNNGDEGEDRP